MAMNVYGLVELSSGDTYDGIRILSTGQLLVTSGIAVTNITVICGGKLNGFAFQNDVEIASIYYLSCPLVFETANLYDGQLATEVSILPGGSLYAHAGARINNICIKSNASLSVANDTVISGKVITSAALDVTCGDWSQVAELAFDLSQDLLPSGQPLINDFSAFGEAELSIMVSAQNQPLGNYWLVSGLDEDCDLNIGVFCGEEQVAVLTDEVVTDKLGWTYHLWREDDNLWLTVSDITPPDAPLVTANVKYDTMNPVVVTAEFATDTVVKEYSLDGGNGWQEYSSPLVVEENGILWFRGWDNAGNCSIVEYVVDNIFEPLEFYGGNEARLSDCFAVEITDSGWYGFDWVTENNFNGKIILRNGKKTIASVSVKNGELVNGRQILLDSSGKYNLEIVSGDKGRTWCEYQINLAASELFTRGNNEDDVWNVWHLPFFDYESGWQDWVGHGDSIDYCILNLEYGCNLAFDIAADDKVKFTLWSINKTGKLKKNMSVSIGAGREVTTRGQLLSAGQYYLSVESVNAKKGGSAEYSININGNSKIYDSDNGRADNSFDDLDVADFFASEASCGWVGFGDTIDFLKLDLDDFSNLSFNLSSTDNAKFIIWQYNEANGKLKKLQQTNVKKEQALNTKNLLLKAGEYYLSMESTNAKKGGSADYSIAAAMS